MKKFSLFFACAFITSLSFASVPRQVILRKEPSSPFTLQCNQTATYTSSGSYTCNGIPYDVSVSATASASDEDCMTASAEATATAALLSEAALLQSLQALQSNCVQ